MTRVLDRGEKIRRYILENVEKYPNTINKVTSEHFQITRQAVNKHLQKLRAEKALTETGNTKNRSYKLCPLFDWEALYNLGPDLAEDRVWDLAIRSQLGQMPDNVMGIWHYGFTELFNNAIDHSAGSRIYVKIRKNAVTTEMYIADDGYGIFKKIQKELGLLDIRHAIFELAKGKLTTDPTNHTGEGIFFSSRMFDEFDILSEGVYFSHKFGDAEDWITEQQKIGQGTGVWMKLHNHTARTTRKIFDQYTSGDEDHGFNKTVVPVKLAQYGNDELISRSQAKRLMARLELFKIVLFDFAGVPSIGQAFADEIFRVFALKHPEIHLIPIHESSEVKRMILRAQSGNVSGIISTDN